MVERHRDLVDAGRDLLEARRLRVRAETGQKTQADSIRRLARGWRDRYIYLSSSFPSIEPAEVDSSRGLIRVWRDCQARRVGTALRQASPLPVLGRARV